MPNTDESFRIDSSRVCSHWMVDADARLTRCSHHPSPELLGAVANNQKEQRARQRVLSHYPNKFAGYSAFAKAYVEAVRAGRSMDTISPTKEKVSQRAENSAGPSADPNASTKTVTAA